MYGRVPAHLPAVTWRVASVEHETIGGVAAETRHVIGHVDNRAAPGINVDIDARLTLPAQVRGKVTVMINLRWIMPPRLAKGVKLPTEHDRRSVGWGKSVYGRVVRGVRGVRKKKRQ